MCTVYQKNIFINIDVVAEEKAKAVIVYTA